MPYEGVFEDLFPGEVIARLFSSAPLSVFCARAKRVRLRYM